MVAISLSQWFPAFGDNAAAFTLSVSSNDYDNVDVTETFTIARS